MKRNIWLTGVLAAAGLTMTAAAVNAGDIKARLDGYEEIPMTISTDGSGEFKGKLNRDKTAIDYTLTYQDLSSHVLQAHIHFGRRATAGQIVLYLCTNLTPPLGVPVPPACPDSGTVTGTLTAANVIPRANQGIDAGAAGFAEILDAIREGAAYVNVHTETFPSGEIRNQVNGHAH
jgi:hypothetical protein